MSRANPIEAMRRRSVAALLALAAAAMPFVIGGARAGAAAPADPLAASPIKHVVVIYQENHSFNDILGALCVAEHDRCVGTTQGQISDGTVIPLKPEPDVPPDVGHKDVDQLAAMNHGKMNGWDHVWGCSAVYKYNCLTQVQAGTIPTIWSLADRFTISDHTFESGSSASWGSHIQLVAATLDGFMGDQPFHSTPGTGCNSGGEAFWSASPTATKQLVPSCIPNKEGQGPFRPSPVKYVPTIMDSMEQAGKSWHIYAPGPKNAGYGWAICPTFYECLGGDQAKKIRQPHDFARDAAQGQLPNLSIVIPYFNDSQHPGYSLMRGDNWIAKNVNAVMNGPDWDSTAIFLTWDDCGCFYDPVAPPSPEWGIRVPLQIISPYARPGYTDSTPATFVSMLAFVEHTFGVAPLNPCATTGDPGCTDDEVGLRGAPTYDFANAFDFSQTPLRGTRPIHTALDPFDRRHLAVWADRAGDQDT
jgi:phospholipase C